MSAVISDCKKYRYLLSRDILPGDFAHHKNCLFIMLNPSTADAENDDPTIRRCIHFAKREGATRLRVVNLFAYRATNPKELYKAKRPIGPENEDYIVREMLGANIIIAAWGSQKIAEPRWKLFKQYGKMKCLGKTKSGAPRHPLYVKNDQPLVDF